MKFRDKDGRRYLDIDEMYPVFCAEKWCDDCRLGADKIHTVHCYQWAEDHPAEAAALMGYEIIEEDATPSQEAKSDANKPRPTLVPTSLVRAVTAIREYGTAKYGDPENWLQVEPERYRDAAYRHWLDYLEDHDAKDEESGLPSLWHLACNVAFLIELEARNDRK